MSVLDFLAEEKPKETEKATEQKSEVFSGTPAPEGPGNPSEVSTGNSFTTFANKSIISKERLKEISGKFNHQFTISTHTSYVKLALEFVKEFEYYIVPTLGLAIEFRGIGNKAITYHEADVAYRSQFSLDSKLLWSSLSKLSAFITEEDDRFTKNVFVLRARYNKGLEWKKEKRIHCSPAAQIEGDLRLENIIDKLKELDLPLHTEEIKDGVTHEFLKPEYMNFNQFQQAIIQVQKTRTMAEKDEMNVLLGALAPRSFK